MIISNLPLNFTMDVNVIPDFFDYSNLILTIATVLLSLLAIHRTFKESRTSFEIGIINMVQEAKTNLDNNMAQLHNIEDASRRTFALKTYIENYLNALDTACAMYFSKDVKKKRFETLYLEDIKSLYQNQFFHDLIYKKLESYVYLKKFIIEKNITNLK